MHGAILNIKSVTMNFFNTIFMVYVFKFFFKETMTLEQVNERANQLIFKSWFPKPHYSEMGDCLHVLDVYRKSLLQQKVNHKKKKRRGETTQTRQANW